MLEVLRRRAARLIAPERDIGPKIISIGRTRMRLYGPEDALKISTVFRCVRVKSDTSAALHWGVYRDAGGGSFEALATHPLVKLLSRRPNEEMGAFAFRRLMGDQVQLWGNFYAEIGRDRSGRVAALYPIDASRVEPKRQADGQLYYQISNPAGGLSELAPSQIMHVRGPSPDGIRGYSILELARMQLEGAANIDGFAHTYFENGMKASAVFEVPKEVSFTIAEHEQLLAAYEQSHRGAQNAGRPMVLDRGITLKDDGINPEDAQMLDTRKFSVTDICRWFGVPPYLVFSNEQQPRANVEAQSREFVQYGLMPLLRAQEEAADMCLLSRAPADHYTRIAVDRLTLGDLATRANYYRTMRLVGAFSVNDVLRLEGRPTIGPEGDQRQTQAQEVPLASSGGEQSRPGSDRAEDDEDGDSEEGDGGGDG